MDSEKSLASNVTSANELPGCRIVENLGIVRGVVVRRDIVASPGNWQTLGRKITTCHDLCEQSRKDAFDRMLDSAGKLGANGIVGFRYESGMAAEDATEVLAYGTAVRTEKI